MKFREIVILSGGVVFGAAAAIVLLLTVFEAPLEGFLHRSHAPDAAEDEHDHEAHSAPDTVVVSPEVRRSAGIEVMEAAEREITSTLQTTGFVGPNESRVAHIRPLARGIVDAVYARLGDRVRAGDRLVRYDNIDLGEVINEYLTELAELQNMETNLEVSLKMLERAKALLENQALSSKEYEWKAAEAKNAAAAVERQKAQLAKYEEKLHRYGLTDAEIDELPKPDRRLPHRTAAHSDLKAPFSGVVTAHHVSEGEVIEPEMEVMTITDIETVWVLADVYEKDLALVKRGQEVKVEVTAYPGRVFTGRITHIADRIDSASRTAKVRCEVQNRDRELKLEMFATVTIPATGVRSVMAVPETAVQSIDGRSTVFVQCGPDEFAPREVRLGSRTNGWVEVRSGLARGDKIAVQGSFYLKSGLLRERIGVHVH